MFMCQNALKCPGGRIVQSSVEPHKTKEPAATIQVAARAEATFEFDPAVAFPREPLAKAEVHLQRFSERLRSVSKETFSVLPLRTTPLESLEWIEIPLEGLDCMACSLTVYEALMMTKGVEQATASFKEGRALVLIDPKKVDQDALWKPLRERGVSDGLFNMAGGIPREGKADGVWKRWAAAPRKEPASLQTNASAPGKESTGDTSPYVFVTIPAGSYHWGDLSGDRDFGGAPIHKVNLSGYSMAVNDTTKEQWDVVRSWGSSNGYTDLAEGAGRAGNHPVQTVNWYDVVKWCNAASEKDGLALCYQVDGAVYRIGASDGVTCDWKADGYRLPTEVEWEVTPSKAGRYGRASVKRGQEPNKRSVARESRGSRPIATRNATHFRPTGSTRSPAR